jgi:8-oxo-dGTP diphosphatase
MSRITRFQGAIVCDDHILLIKQHENVSGREYWVIPGGGREAGETEQECIEREMREETHLHVVVKALLLDEPGRSQDAYQRFKTYLCTPLGGKAEPGCEPECEVSQAYAITEVRWFDLRDEATWGADVVADPFTYPVLRKIRAMLGYTAGE